MDHDHDGQPGPAMASAALVPGPPAATSPAWTDEGSLQLLEILRLSVRGVPDWMLPRYIVTGVDIYNRKPEELFRSYPSAASAYGKKAVYFVNIARAKSKNDSRRSRVAPDGTWKTERGPADIWGAKDIAGTRQALSFTIKVPEGEDLRSGYIAQEFALSGSAGRLAGGDQLVLTKLYFTPRGEEAVFQAQERVINKARRNKTAAAASSSSRAPLLPPAAAASPEPGKTPAPCVAASRAPRKTPAARVASTLSPPKRAALDSSSSAPLDQAAPVSSSPAPVDQAAPVSSAGRPTPSTRWLLLEVGDSPANLGDDFLVRKIHRAAQLVGSSLPLNTRKLLPFDCQDLFLVKEGTKKMFPSSP